jgi:hypothetical protein
MIAIIARSLWARKRRLVATLLAVALGVAFLAGTLLLSDTLRANFDRLFTQADGGANVVLRGATEIGSGNSARTGVDASLLPRVRTVPGVADAQPYLEGYGQLLGRDGQPIGGNGLAAQRGRESALLRALGGTRRQLAVAGLAETLVVGVVGSVAGWAGGIGIAALLKGVFDSFGFALPAGGLVLRASSAVLAVAVGVAATVLAGVLPALRASRVPPLAALRELAAEPARISRVRSVLGFLLTGGGVAAVIAGTAGGGQGPAIAGAVGTLAGFVVLGPAAVRPAAALLGAPIAALRGVDGRLARDNALRNPRRTAATASALMVGVAVATLFTVIGASLKASATQGVGRALAADLVVYQPGHAGGAGKAGFSPQLAAGLGRLPSVGVAAGVSRGSVLLNGQAQTIAAVDPDRIGSVLNLGVTAGSLGAVDSGSFAVSAAAAADQHWRVGSRVPVVYPRRHAGPAAGRGCLRPPGRHRRLSVRRGRLGPARRAAARRHGADQAEAGCGARPGARRRYRGHRHGRPAAGAGPGAIPDQRG